ncbi:transposase [Paenibacillus larvae]|nr:transposase [Paenibacillus larvae]MDT2295603.1 transposase [Paenibacillus larvae]
MLQTSQNASYSAELKRIAVEDYLAGGSSHMDICKRYGIKSTCQLRDWILKYNSHEKLNTSGTGGVPIMTKGQETTTYDEELKSSDSALNINTIMPRQLINSGYPISKCIHGQINT